MTCDCDYCRYVNSDVTHAVLSYIILFKLLLFAFKSCFKFCELFKYWRVVVFLIRLSRAALSVYLVVVVVTVVIYFCLLLESVGL